MAEFLLKSRSPLQLPVDGISGPDLSLVARDGLGIVSIQVWPGMTGGVQANLKRAFNIDVRDGPYRTCFADLAIIGTGPGSWLMFSDNGSEGLAEVVEAELSNCATVTDQSSGYAVFRLTGARSSDLLAKGVFIDLGPSAFPPGSAATTQVFKINVVLSRLKMPGAPAFEIAVARSMAASIWHAFEVSAAAFSVA